MKILDIITPHETLDEDWKQTARRALDRVTEPVRIFFGERPPRKVVSDMIDDLLAGPGGEQLKRTPEMKQAESKLVSVLENSPFQDKTDLTKIDTISNALSDWMVSTGKPIPEGNTLKLLYTLVEEGSVKVPESYGSKAEFLRDPFITAEIGGRVIGGEARYAVDGPVGKYVRELSDAKSAVKTEANNIKNPKPSGFDKLVAKMADIIKQNKALKSMWNPLKLANIKRGFFLFELDKIFQPMLEQWKLADQWHDSKANMPDTVADHFPVVPPNLDQGSHITSKNTTPTYTYSTEAERYECAYNWVTIHLAGQAATQVFTWMVSYWATGKLISKAGTFGKWTWTKTFFNNIAYLQNNPHVDQAIKAYIGKMSQYSRLIFVDYLTTASNGTPGSASLIKQIQDYAVSNGMQPIRDYPEIQNLPEAIASMTVDSLFDLHNPVYGFLLDAVTDAGIPFTLHYVAFKEAITAAVQWTTPVVIKIIDALLKPAEKQIVPGVPGEPSRSRDRTNAPANNASTTTTDPGASSEISNTSPPEPPASSASSSEVVPPAATTNTGNGVRRQKLDETLKYKVLARMKS